MNDEPNVTPELDEVDRKFKLIIIDQDSDTASNDLEKKDYSDDEFNQYDEIDHADTLNTTENAMRNDLLQDEFDPNNKKPQYEVVLYVRYNLNDKGRPDEKSILDKFNKYGVVDYVKCPEDTDYAFIFMKKLNTTVKHRRTRTVIDKIKSDMTVNDCFYIDVARSTKYKNTSFNKFTAPSYKVMMEDTAFQPGLIHPALFKYYQPKVPSRAAHMVYRPNPEYINIPPPKSVQNRVHQNHPVQTRSSFIPAARPVFTSVQRTLKNDKVEIPELKKQGHISIIKN